MMQENKYQYNNLIRHEGIPMISQAVLHMPGSLLETMVAEYEGSEFGDYLFKEQERRKQDKEPAIVRTSFF